MRKTNIIEKLTENFKEFLDINRDIIQSLLDRDDSIDEVYTNLVDNFKIVETCWKERIDDFISITDNKIHHLLFAEYPPEISNYIYMNNQCADFLKNKRAIVIDCLPLTLSFGGYAEDKPSKQKWNQYIKLIMRSFDYYISLKISYISKSLDEDVNLYVLYLRLFKALKFCEWKKNILDVDHLRTFSPPKRQPGIKDRITSYFDSL